jgi:phenylacetate 2-hydroxylase
MVAGGLDTLPSTIIMTMGFLSSSSGQEIQKRALEDIMRTYPDGDAWERCLLEEKVPYITALTKVRIYYLPIQETF